MVVGLLVAVVSFGGGLTASADTADGDGGDEGYGDEEVESTRGRRRRSEEDGEGITPS